MNKQLTDEEQDTINTAKEDLIHIYSEICDRYGFNSRIAKKLDKILGDLESLQNDYKKRG